MGRLPRQSEAAPVSGAERNCRREKPEPMRPVETDGTVTDCPRPGVVTGHGPALGWPQGRAGRREKPPGQEDSDSQGPRSEEDQEARGPRLHQAPKRGQRGHRVGRTSEQDAVVPLLRRHPDGRGEPVHAALPRAVQRVLGRGAQGWRPRRRVGAPGRSPPPAQGCRGSRARGRGSPAAQGAAAAAARRPAGPAATRGTARPARGARAAGGWAAAGCSRHPLIPWRLPRPARGAGR